MSVDQPATSVVRVQNVSRLPSGLLCSSGLRALAARASQRFVIDRLESGGRRDVRYELRGAVRGRYTVGLVSVQLVDPFGLCRATRQFTTTDMLTVVPATVPLPAIPSAATGQAWRSFARARWRRPARTT